MYSFMKYLSITFDVFVVSLFTVLPSTDFAFAIKYLHYLKPYEWTLSGCHFLPHQVVSTQLFLFMRE